MAGWGTGTGDCDVAAVCDAALESLTLDVAATVARVARVVWAGADAVADD
jgi:hypothetical protein